MKTILFWGSLVLAWFLIGLSWWLNEDRKDAWEWSSRYNELSIKANALSSAFGDYHLGRIDIDSVIVVKDYYGNYLKETTKMWMER